MLYRVWAFTRKPISTRGAICGRHSGDWSGGDALAEPHCYPVAVPCSGYKTPVHLAEIDKVPFPIDTRTDWHDKHFSSNSQRTWPGRKSVHSNQQSMFVCRRDFVSPLGLAPEGVATWQVSLGLAILTKYRIQAERIAIIWCLSGDLYQSKRNTRLLTRPYIEAVWSIEP